MTQPPDYVAQPYPQARGTLPSTYQWQGMSQDQIEALRKRLIESIIQVVVQAVKGFFVPGGGVGGALEQFISLFTDIDISDFLEGDWANLLEGLLDGSFPINAQTLFGNLSSELISLISINAIGAPETKPMTAGTFPDASSIQGGGVWSFDPTTSRTADSTGSMRTSANGSTKAIRGDLIAISQGQKIEPSIFVRWFSYVGAGPTVELHVVKYSGNTETGTQFLAAITPTAGTSAGWTELTGTYTAGSGVTKIRTRLVVTSGAAAGNLNFDEGTYEVRSNFVDNLTSWFRLPSIGNLFGNPDTFDLSALIPVPVQNTIDELFQTLSGLTRVDNLLTDLRTALQNIKFENILGVGGPLNLGASILEGWSSLIGGFVGSTGSGVGIADLFNIGNIIGSGSALGGFSWDILGIRNNKSMNTGMLATSVSPVSFQKITSGASATSFGITSSTATTLWHRFAEGMSLGVISWLGNGTTSITDMRVNIWKMNPLTGTQDLVHASANIIGDVSGSGTPQYNTYEIPDPIAVDATDIYGAEIEVRAGAGTHTIAGEQSWEPSHPTVFPRKMQTRRNPGGTTPPASIVTGSIDYATTNRPYIEFAVETGPGAEFHEPQRVPYISSATTVVPNWCTSFDRIIFPAGGGGHGGSTQIGLDGEGGDNGTPIYDTLVRGVDFTGTPTVTITLGAHGNGGGLAGNGSSAANSTIAVTGASTLTGTGGAGGNSFVVGSARNGQSPGTIVVNGFNYAGGGTQGTAGADGAPYGGGGAGGGYFQSGGDGAPAMAWLVFRQS
jgi:hypothetical protein